MTRISSFLLLIVLLMATPAFAADEQQIGRWEWDKFKWVAPDPALVRNVEVKLTIPAGHHFVTVAIDDANGLRARNLANMADVTKLGGDPASGQPQTLNLTWNGLDDWGNPMPEGTYKVRGLSLPGLKATYDYTFYNPGNPPWEGYKNSGWGGDHVFPGAIACMRGQNPKGWKTVIGGPTAEGGDSMFALDNQGNKIWGYKNGWSGPWALACDEGLLYQALDGQKLVFRIDGNKQVSFQNTLNLNFEEDATAIAVGRKWIAVLVGKGKNDTILAGAPNKVVLLDKLTGKPIKDWPSKTPYIRNGLAFDQLDRLYIAGEQALNRVDENGEMAELAWKQLKSPGPLASDNEGNIYAVDRGADYQVKVFSPDGKQLRTIGTKGGQTGLKYDRAAMHDVDAISVDGEGNLWASECGTNNESRTPGKVRRIAVWKADGTFLKHFVGNPGYGVSNTSLHGDDPTIGYSIGVIYKIDPTKVNAYEPLQYLYSGPKNGSTLNLSSGSNGALFAYGKLFSSSASGTKRQYFLYSPAGLNVLFLDKGNGDYRPVAATGSNEANPAFPKGPGQFNNHMESMVWSDRNEDEICQPDEFVATPGGTLRAISVGWQYTLAEDLTFYIDQHAVAPSRYTPAGAPIYEKQTMTSLASAGNGAMIRVGNHLMGGMTSRWMKESGVFGAGRHLFTDLKGNLQAMYPGYWPGVHASFASPVPVNGNSVGELFVSGVAKVNDEVGSVIAWGGNLGQAFLWSEDGLYISNLFRDTRQNPKGQGDHAEKGLDWTDVTMSAEAFGGWFGRQSDGKFRYLFGRNAANVVQVQGLEQVKRFDAGMVQLKAGNPSPAAATDRTLVARRNMYAPNIDGYSSDWIGVPRSAIKVGDSTVATVAALNNGGNLYLLYEVRDDSPMKNARGDNNTLFKQGDAVDLMIGPAEPANRQQPAAGDLRLLMVPPGNDKPAIAMLYRPVVPGTPADKKVPFVSPVRQITMDSVEPVKDVQMAFRATKDGYVCEVQIPLGALGVQPAAGLKLRGDMGVLFSNAGGMLTERRSYLFNPNTAIVSDLPSEAEILPQHFGFIVWE